MRRWCERAASSEPVVLPVCGGERLGREKGERYLRQVRRGTARATRPRAKNAYDTPFERLCVRARACAYGEGDGGPTPGADLVDGPRASLRCRARCRTRCGSCASGDVGQAGATRSGFASTTDGACRARTTARARKGWVGCGRVGGLGRRAQWLSGVHQWRPHPSFPEERTEPRGDVLPVRRTHGVPADERETPTEDAPPSLPPFPSLYLAFDLPHPVAYAFTLAQTSFSEDGW